MVIGNGHDQVGAIHGERLFKSHSSGRRGGGVLCIRLGSLERDERRKQEGGKERDWGNHNKFKFVGSVDIRRKLINSC
jgi:hypothetical protein